MINLITIKDPGSVPLWARRISDTTVGYYTQPAIIYPITIPAGAQIAIISGSLSYLISSSSFTFPAAPGDSIPNGVLLNPGTLYLKDISTLYISTQEEALINVEFYSLIGGGEA